MAVVIKLMMHFRSESRTILQCYALHLELVLINYKKLSNRKFVFINGVDDNVSVMSSVARPKKITFIGTDGNRYGILCKPDDDLRKDAKVMEVNGVVNWYLHRNPESRQRQLRVRAYCVTPLNELHGMLEWVPNLTGLRGILSSLYRERGLQIKMGEFDKLFCTSFV